MKNGEESSWKNEVKWNKEYSVMRWTLRAWKKCENVGFSVFIHTQFHLITDKTYLAEQRTRKKTQNPLIHEASVKVCNIRIRYYCFNIKTKQKKKKKKTEKCSTVLIANQMLLYFIQYERLVTSSECYLISLEPWPNI